MMSNYPSERRGMTLIELLVVVAVIMVLMALLLPTVSYLRRNSRFYVTIQRMGDIQNAITRLASERGSAAQLLQRRCLGGAIAFTHDANGVLRVSEGAWLDYTQPWQLRFPWGRPSVTWAQRGKPLFAPPRSFGLSDCTPIYTAELLQAAEIITKPADLYDNRNDAAAWNDGFGNPLVVAIALYQYGPDTASSWPSAGFAEATAPSSDFTRQWGDAERHLGSTRSLYVSVGALGTAGTDPAITATPSAADWQAWWSRIETACNRDEAGDELWCTAITDQAPTTTSWTDPVGSRNAERAAPWQGVRRQSANGFECALAAPIAVP
jgi:prepilin-type N-terminal cleavage/methylation domain-containing protein